MNRKFAFIGIFGSSLLLGCFEKKEPISKEKSAPPVTIGDVKSDASKAISTASEYTTERKNKMVQNWKDQMSEMDTQLDDLRKKGEQLAADSKDAWNKKMTTLEAKRKVAKDKIAEMENSTADAWSDIEKGTAAAWNDFKNAFQDASKEF
ncbi:MAG: hypothetical protein MUC43_10135 [Pirellula sp.]|jgi:hypothetical protein|nr:hypothetical protein [Pirellula sp.]